MARGSAAGANRQRKGGGRKRGGGGGGGGRGRGGSKRGERGGFTPSATRSARTFKGHDSDSDFDMGGGRGTSFRGLELAYDWETDDVIVLGKKGLRPGSESKKKGASGAAGHSPMVLKKSKKAQKDLSHVPELRLDKPRYLQLRKVLERYQKAQAVIEKELAAYRRENGEDGEDSEDEDDDDDEEEDDDDDEDGDDMEGLIREMNGASFYDRSSTSYSDEEDDSESGDEEEPSDNEDDADYLNELAGRGKGQRTGGAQLDDDSEDDVDVTSETNEEDFDLWGSSTGPVAPTKVAVPSRRVFDIPSPDPRKATDSAYIAWLESLGVARTYATSALQHTNNDRLAAVAYLYSKAGATVVLPETDLGPELSAEAADMREAERTVLESMYQDHFSFYTRDDGSAVWQISGLQVDLPPQIGTANARSSTLKLTLQLHHRRKTAYPFEPPIVVLQASDNPVGSRQYSAPILALAMMLQLCATEHVGEAVTDILTMSLQTPEATTCISNVSKRVMELASGQNAQHAIQESIGKASSSASRVLVIKHDSETATSSRQASRSQSNSSVTVPKLIRGPRGGVPTMNMLDYGIGVAVCLKEDQGTDRLVTGLLDEFLTRGDHPRGIKVRLQNGKVGRVQAVIKPAAQLQTSVPKQVDRAATPIQKPPRSVAIITNDTLPRTPTAAPMETPVKQQENRPQPAPVIPTKPPPELKALNHKLFDQHQHRSSDPAILKMIEARQRLPAWDHQKLILDALASHRVIVVEGETGCGKTTQVPQFILDDFITKRRGAECNILVTQPRRISAIGVAERVAAERAEPLGKTVGYQIRLESRMSDQTRILFATTGILLRRLEGAGAKAMDANGSDAKHPSDNYEGGIDDITHIVVDEVHERSVDSDFLLMVLRDLLETNTKLKVVLMSATLNAALFQDYFGGPAVTPRIHIPGRTFPVKVMFLEDALAKTKYIPSDKTLTRPPVFQRGNGRQQRRTDLPSSGTDDSDDGLHRPRKSKAEVVTDSELDAIALQKRYPHIPEKAIGSLSVLDVDKIQYPLIEKLVEWMCERLLPGCGKRVPPGLGNFRGGRGQPGLRGSPGGRGGRGAGRGGMQAGMTPSNMGSDEIPIGDSSNSGGKEPANRGILIFLPGYAEISTLHDLLTANPLIRSATGSGRFCIPLHGNLSSMDQLRVFKRPDDGAVKIVIATNVAETSITVDDVVCVIDTGKMKETRYDPAKGMASLEECWVSKANAMQRRGRAGRVTEGLCVHLFTSHTFENGLAQQQIPEMRRTPLEQLCLRIKVLPFLRGRIHHILENVIEPPSREAVTNAIMTLRSLQALTREEDLTPLGFHLGRLPVDVRIGKLIVFGSIFQCVDSVLTIAAIMSHKSPFVAPFDKREMADARKRDFALESSDQLTLLNAYNQWSAIKTKGFAAEKKFLFDNFLSGKSLTMIASIKRQLAELLEDIGFLDDGYVQFLRNLERQRGGTGTVDDHHANARGNDFKLVKALLVAALYPNVIKQGPETKPGASAESNLIVKGNEQVFIHPTSINFRRLPPNVMSNRSSTPFLVYHEKVKTSKVFVRDSSLVTSHALAFFGGSVKWDPRQGYLNMEDGWIRFRAQPKVAAVIEGARAALDEVLQRKIQEPTLDISNDPIFDVIVSVVTG